jgi:uncharacterized RDD family membrane protein YckC
MGHNTDTNARSETMDTENNSPELPAEAKWHLEQAYTAEERHELETALRECELALQFAPDCAEAHNLRGLILEGLSRKEESLAAYREAVRLDPAFQEAQENLHEAEAELEAGPRETKTELSPMAIRPAAEGKKFAIRAGAYMLDYAIMYVCILAAGFTGGILLRIGLPIFGRQLLSSGQIPSVWQWILGMIVITIYFALFEWRFGASPGKLILRMRVVQEDGHPCTLWAAFVRGLLRFIDGLVFAMPAYSSMKKTPLRQRLGDRAAKTIVVDSRAAIIQQRRSWWGFWLAGGAFFILALLVLDAQALMFGQIVPTKSLALIHKAAADINLQLNDLDISFTQSGEDAENLFPNNKNVTDTNQRLFASRGLAIQSRVVMFRAYLTDKTSDVTTAVEKGVRQEFEGQTLVFKPATNVTVSERGSIQKFSDDTTGNEGYAMFFIKQNVLARLIVYGQPEKVNADNVQALAHIIDERIR